MFRNYKIKKQKLFKNFNDEEKNFIKNQFNN